MDDIDRAYLSGYNDGANDIEKHREWLKSVLPKEDSKILLVEEDTHACGWNDCLATIKKNAGIEGEK
jgi:hypothetical protein